MTPREPDRFEAKARELVDLFVTTGTHITEMRSSLATALRQAAAEALERAAQAFDDEYMRTGKMRAGNNVADELRAMRRAVGPAPSTPSGRDRCKCGVQEMDPGVTRMHELDGLVHSRTACVPSRALASPAAAPAAENGAEDFTDWHRAGAPPSEPAAPECACPPSDRELQSRGLLKRHVKACPLRTVADAPVPAPLLPRVLAALTKRREWALAAELRAYIAEREPAEKRIAELERLANDDAFSGMQHKARADAAEARVVALEARIARSTEPAR